jgi:uncharacterized SAM-binding protein YcdF (DUF218 family)
MRTLFEQFLMVPMPFLWVLLGGLVFWCRPGASRALFASGTILLLLTCLPATGKLMLRGLVDGATPAEMVDGNGLAAVVVPTGGSYDDSAGRWWPATNSVRRAVSGRQLSSRLGVPLIIVGGSPINGQPPESLTVARALGLTNTDVMLGKTARDSAESAAEVARLLSGQPSRRVAVVTSTVHIARMSAALRHHGLDVVAVLSREKMGELKMAVVDFVPSRGGFGLTGGAIHEYVAILWYLVTGRLDIDNL